MIVHKLIEHLLISGEERCLALAHALPSMPKFYIAGEEYLRDEVREYGQMLLHSGLIIPPFEDCYLEFPPGKSDETPTTMGAVVTRGPGGSAAGVIFIKITGNETWMGPWQIGWFIKNDSPHMVVGRYVHPRFIEILSRVTADIISTIAFMDLKETEVRDVPVKDRVNRQRIAQGRQPFYPHKVLTLTKAAKEALMSSDHHASLVKRRAHWRRGHLRHLPGKIVPVAPALVRGEGFVSKDYRV